MVSKEDGGPALMEPRVKDSDGGRETPDKHKRCPQFVMATKVTARG